ncbi:MAG: glycosyltransferase family 4 protein [Chloroflexota bacterium]
MIRPLILSSQDIVGGAARATYRLHQALRSIGVDSKMLVQTKYSQDNHVIGAQSRTSRRLTNLTFRLDQYPLRGYPDKRPGFFSPQWVPERTAVKATHLAPDIINLHWVNNGFLRIESIKALPAPMVWTLHDMWPFTGGCHYSGDCNRYTQPCGYCTLLNSQTEKDLSHKVWQRKSKSWHDVQLTIVALSRWLADCARQSALFANRPIKVIPNCIDTDIWHPVATKSARAQLNLPQDKKIIGFGALKPTGEHRKGFHHLVDALAHLAASDPEKQIELAILGEADSKQFQDLPLKTHLLGKLDDDHKMALFYASLDTFVLPSLEDNLPNTIMEAMACAVPCVAFNIGGILDMVDHKINGFLCAPFDSQELAEGVKWILEDWQRQQMLSEKARQKVLQTFAPKLVANQYLDLYLELME